LRPPIVLIAALAASAGLSACSDSHKSTPQTNTATVFTVPAKLPPRAHPTTTGETTAPSDTATVSTPTAPATPSAGSSAPKPPIVGDFIPFPAQRKAEMAAYTQRHYGTDSYVLSNPKVIVEHVAVAPSAAAVKATFSPDNPDPELHELPQVCSHFVIDRDGTIHQLVPLDVMCRHTVGLNYTAIGIEHAGFTDQDVLSDAAQLDASLRLTTWLRCRYGIKISNVIGHNESLSSPFHHENVPALRSQTHGDMQHASMETYRQRLAAHPCT
jgi:Negative regulator of beta-lactamase expression